jgi:hypothetical protein
MYVCPQCASSIGLKQFEDSYAACPRCGAAIPRDESATPWVDVARVGNLAEAGFLTDELIGLGVDARIHQVEEFSALSDRWQTAYLIRVPSASTSAAAARIRQHLVDEVEETGAGAMGFRFSAESDAIDPLFWRPVALVVLAGVASFMLGQRFSEQRVERRLPRGPLATAVGAIGRPLVTESAPGEPRYRLSVDRRREVWLLDIDRDGDGIYDRQQHFPAHAAAW